MLPENPVTWFEVRFTCYQYNSGRGDNGFLKCWEKFRTIEECNVFLEYLGRVQQNDPDSEFASMYVSSGYFERVEGVWKCREQQVI